MSVVISAIICTHNRADRLKQALRSLIDQSLPRGEYEVLVVDNASSDNTAEVVRSFVGQGNVRYLYESQLGLSRARNAGVASAQGRYVAFLDDDAAADPNWVKNILDAFQSSTEKVACVGGKVDLVWDTARPAWLGKGSKFFLSELDLFPHPQVLRGEEHFLHGCNMAFDKRVLCEAGGFDEHLGRRGTDLLSGEDVAIQKTLRKRGHQVVYHPGIRVRHAVPPYRTSLPWLMKRFAGEGASLAVLALRQERPRFFSRACIVLQETFKFLLLFRALSFVFPAKNAFLVQQRCLAVQKMSYILRMAGFPAAYRSGRVRRTFWKMARY